MFQAGTSRDLSCSHCQFEWLHRDGRCICWWKRKVLFFICPQTNVSRRQAFPGPFDQHHHCPAVSMSASQLYVSVPITPHPLLPDPPTPWSPHSLTTTPNTHSPPIVITCFHNPLPIHSAIRRFHHTSSLLIFSVRNELMSHPYHQIVKHPLAV